MSKAIEGAAMLAGAIGMGVAAFMDPALIASPFFDKAMAALALGGLSMEAGAIAGALTANRGQNITTKQPAAYRQIIYGCQRVGGTLIFESTTGSSKRQFNQVIVLATHECWAIEALYLDGRRVYFDGTSVGASTRNGFAFGGSANGNTYTGPTGTQYNFGGLVYCEARYGDQAFGDVIGGLTANDPNWIASGGNSPCVMGCTYIYLKVEGDANQFPQPPEVRVTVRGKPVYDPRTSLTAYSENWALIVNDVLTDTEFGLGDPAVNQDQLVAAANICDEQVALASGQTESRYTCHWHYDTSTAPGDVLSTMMSAAGGKLSQIGGEWYIQPAVYVGPSASFGADVLTGPVQWSSTRSYKEMFNRVTGTYVAPNWPYAIAGDLYDSNGFDAEGHIQDNFELAFQPTNFPQYACDVLHGYASDEYYAADRNRALPKELALPCVLSVGQAQRLAKITLLRNRQQRGSGTLSVNLTAYQLQPLDTFQMTFAQQGWADKLLEVTGTRFRLDSGSNGQAPKIMFEIDVQETASTIYEWSAVEELSIYDAGQISNASQTPVPPTNLTLISSAATALLQADGSVVPRLQLNWDTPLDGAANSIEIQYQGTGGSVWIAGGSADIALNTAYISPVVSGQSYNVRIRSARSNGAVSSWVTVNGFTASIVLSVSSHDAIGNDSLVGEAFSDGTAAIVVEPFSALLGNVNVSYLPSGPVTISGLTQQTMYYVYLVDSTLSGGDLTPIATVTSTDYLGKLGYFLIGTVVTPYASATSGATTTNGTRYYPTVYQDVGSRTTINPAAAFDGNTSTSATVSSTASDTASTTGDLVLSGFPQISLSYASTLNVVISSSIFTTGSTASIAVGVSGAITYTTLSAGAQTFTASIPASTILNDITVEIIANASPVTIGDSVSRRMGTALPPTGASTGRASVSITEIYIL